MLQIPASSDICNAMPPEQALLLLQKGILYGESGDDKEKAVMTRLTKRELYILHSVLKILELE